MINIGRIALSVVLCYAAAFGSRWWLLVALLLIIFGQEGLLWMLKHKGAL